MFCLFDMNDFVAFTGFVDKIQIFTLLFRLHKARLSMATPGERKSKPLETAHVNAKHFLKNQI